MSRSEAFRQTRARSGDALLMAFLLYAAACSSQGGSDDDGSAGAGSGSTGSGAGSGGATSGAVGAGGASAAGGSTGSGGATGAGGSLGSGGTTASGGDGVVVGGTCYPICADAATDPDGDGWGWENEASCVVSTAPEAANPKCNLGGGTGGTTGAGGSGGSSGGGGGSGGSVSVDCSDVGDGVCPTDFTCPPGFGPKGSGCDCYNQPGLGANKCALLQAGADRYMLASAMMETETMDANSYPLGDVYPGGDMKTGDAFNAGVCKQNWGMMRQCHQPWQSLSQGDYLTSAAMNDDLALDVTVYEACRAMFGDDWWAGHRNGAAGLENPNTQDIQNFKAAMDWTYERLAGHETDNVRFWVTVPPIQ